MREKFSSYKLGSCFVKGFNGLSMFDSKLSYERSVNCAFDSGKRAQTLGFQKFQSCSES